MNTVMKEVLPRRHRLTVEDYGRMAELGLLAPDARTELIEGEIIDMAPIGNPHMGTVDELARIFLRAVDDRAVVRIQGAVRLNDYSMPQPDLALLKRRERHYYHANPATPADVHLIVEVSDTTLHYDRQIKAPLYARHAIPEVWIVELNSRRLHVLRSPTPEGYAEVSLIETPGPMKLSGLEDIAVDLTGLFPS